LDMIYGYLERIVFYSEESSFIVAKIKEKEKRELTTVVGNLSGLNPGVFLKLEGKWVHNKKYGEQFQIERMETVAPATVKGIEKYLGSGLIRGVGPVMAKRMVKVFGEDTLDIIENHCEKLSMVEGIGPKRIEMIAAAWEEQKDIKDIMIFLQEYGVSAGYSTKIYKRYGKKSIEIVSENPYRLASDIKGIGFLTADQIAQKIGVDPCSVTRAEEGALYMLNNFAGEGHVYCPYETLVEKTIELLGVDRDIVTKAVASLFEDKRIAVEDLNTGGDEAVPNHKAVYLPAFYTAEVNTARKLLGIRDSQNLVAHIETENILEKIEEKLHIHLAEKQKEAVLLSTRNKVLIITGGPGTGKTTIIKSIINLYKEIGLKVLLAAPTGRAAKRMQEATGSEAKTIHRLLEFSPSKGGFQRNGENPLNTDVVILDEASMIDGILMYNLLKAIQPEASIIMVGDVFQLPAVGAGNVLRDIIDSGEFKVVTLSEIFRQSRESRIIVNAHRINTGEFPDISRPLEGELTDFYFMPESEPESAVRKICNLCKLHIPGKFGFDPVKDIQVLTPMHKGVVGVANLNAELQGLLNPGGQGITIGSKIYKVRDKVMQLENNYDKDVFNGDIGWISSINMEDRELTVNFDGRDVKYDFSEMDEVTLAYAISVHKSQGSEYPVVILPVMIQHYILLQRNLVYTGITRGKKLVIMIGTKKALAISINNNKPLHRYTRLKERLMTTN
jgi:exodeoxyribonuclease V alpha subunit